MLCYNKCKRDHSYRRGMAMARRAVRGSSGFPVEDHDHDRCVDAAIEKAETLCSARGARLTALRREVLSILWSSHAPMGAYDVMAKLTEDGGRAAPMTVRSEERSVGKECVSTCRSRWSSYH